MTNQLSVVWLSSVFQSSKDHQRSFEPRQSETKEAQSGVRTAGADVEISRIHGVRTKGGRNGSLRAGFLRAKEAFPPRRNKLQIVEKMDEEYRMSRAPATK